MNDMSGRYAYKAQTTPSKEWLRALSKYRTPNNKRSILETVITLAGFFGLWASAYLALSASFVLSFVFSVLGGLFLVRLFILQHDCGHNALFSKRWANDWLGRFLGVFTLTPYDVWRRSHALHHAGSGNLDKRGIGDIYTMTVAEYKDRGFWGRLWYRAYRSPFTLFVVGPIYVFGIMQRLPIGCMNQGKKYWISTMGTNLVLFLISAGLVYAVGFWPFVAVFGMTTFIGSLTGMWLFYVQHQFEETEWDRPEDWDMHDAALYGSSYYNLPKPLPWMTGNIGIHHVHHLYSRIPFYRLPEVLRDHPVLGEIRKLTLIESFSCARKHLWCETERRLKTFKEAMA